MLWVTQLAEICTTHKVSIQCCAGSHQFSVECLAKEGYIPDISLAKVVGEGRTFERAIKDAYGMWLEKGGYDLMVDRKRHQSPP